MIELCCEYLYVRYDVLIWLYVPIMSHTRFRVNLHIFNLKRTREMFFCYIEIQMRCDFAYFNQQINFFSYLTTANAEDRHKHA